MLSCKIWAQEDGVTYVFLSDEGRYSRVNFLAQRVVIIVWLVWSNRLIWFHGLHVSKDGVKTFL